MRVVWVADGDSNGNGEDDSAASANTGFFASLRMTAKNKPLQLQMQVPFEGGKWKRKRRWL